MDRLLPSSHTELDIGSAAAPRPHAQRTSVASWVAASVAFAQAPLQERQVVPASGGGYTFAVRPLQATRVEAVASPIGGLVR